MRQRALTDEGRRGFRPVYGQGMTVAAQEAMLLRECLDAGAADLARFINWYIGKLHMAARYDAKLATAFLEVANLEAPPARLLQPAVVMRVIRDNLGRRSGGTEVAPARAQA